MNFYFQAPPLPDLRIVAGVKAVGNVTCLRSFFLRLILRLGLWINRRKTADEAGLLEGAAVRRILVVRLDRIGDVVMMGAFLRELRRGFPEAWVTLVVRPATFNLVETCPYVNEVVIFGDPPVRLFHQGIRLIRTLYLGLFRFRREKYDLAVLPRWDFDSFAGSLLCLLSGASWRVAYSEHVNVKKADFNRGYDCFFTHTIDRRSGRHEVESNLDLLKCLGVAPAEDRLELWWTQEDDDCVEATLQSGGLAGGGRLVALAPGAAEANKIWPMSRFSEVGRWVQREYGASLVVVGGASESAMVHALVEELKPAAVSVAGKLTLRQTVALLRRCMFFVGNDSGPMHLAAAAGIPVVAVYRCVRNGDPGRVQSPSRFGPWGVPHGILQPEHSVLPCVDHCLSSSPHCILEVSVPQVLTAIRALMGAGSPEMAYGAGIIRSDSRFGKGE
jgi:heptosyltransferase-2